MGFYFYVKCNCGNTLSFPVVPGWQISGLGGLSFKCQCGKEIVNWFPHNVAFAGQVAIDGNQASGTPAVNL